VLTKAEIDIRTSAQPRHHLERALLRWIYLRKITPIEDLIAGAPAVASSGGGSKPRPVQTTSTPAARPVTAPSQPSGARPDQPERSPVPDRDASTPARAKDAFLAEIRKNKVVFYNTVVAQAQTIELAGDRVTFTFLPNQRHLRQQCEERRSWLESIAEQATGRKLVVTATLAAAPAPGNGQKETPPVPDRKSALREQAMADAGVQTMLEVFPGEIRDVEEM